MLGFYISGFLTAAVLALIGLAITAAYYQSPGDIFGCLFLAFVVAGAALIAAVIGNEER